MYESINALVWHTVLLSLQCTRANSQRNAHPLSVFEAIVKGIHEASGLAAQGQRMLFRVPGNKRANQLKIQEAQQYKVEVLLFGHDASAAEHWQSAALQYFAPGGRGRNFSASTPQPPRCEHAAAFFKAGPTAPEQGGEQEPDEISLDFLTPLPFTTTPDYPRTWLNGAGLVRCMHERLRRLPGVTPPDLAGLPPLATIPAYWHYQQIEHASRSQPGHRKYLNGCVGPLLLRAEELSAWLPWLRLFERIGLGSQLSFAQGQFRLHCPSGPILDAGLLDPTQIAVTIDRQQARHENLLSELSSAANPPGSTEAAAGIAADLSGAWQPSPLRCVPVARDHDRPATRTRTLELPAPRDAIVFAHLQRLLSEPLDRLFSAHSIGYRKGHSRQDAIARVQAAITDGCTHVLESDIADFFPSVDLDQLWKRLDEVLPRRDIHIRRILGSAIRAHHSRDASSLPRTKGLPLGTALSPLLANLYLDTFDRTIEQLWPGARLIRYADDFIVLTSSEQAAREVLIEADAAASRVGLTLNAHKTSIRRLSEGFDFLGIRFSAEADSERSSDEQASALRKMLYITEPYAFLGLNHDSVTVRGGEDSISTYPLRRTSAIVTLAPCSLSTQLIARLSELGIPLTIAGGSGRQAATIAGDTSWRFDRAALHARRHAQLDPSGRLRLAAEIVDAKLNNYIAIIRQRGKAGTAQLVDKLDAARAQLRTTASLDEIRGIEGDSARHCFPYIASWIQDPAFAWQGRRRHGECPDRLNSLLNLGYHLLFTRINALLRVVGLNPYLGLLHEPSNRFESLTCDLQEPFRPYIDRLVVRLVNLKVIEALDFEENTDGFWLTREARAAFLQHFSREMDRQPMRNHPSLSRLIESQVRAIVQWVTDGRRPDFHRRGGPDE